MNMDHLNYLQKVAMEDVAELLRKEQTYQGSWKKRGGIGAFMVSARKWDRIEEIIKTFDYDIFEAIAADHEGADGSMLAEVRDLRRYLLLIESEMRSRFREFERTKYPIVEPPSYGKTADEKYEYDKRTEIIAESLTEFRRQHDRPAEPNFPGTPNNGGHHAPRLQDGLPLNDIEPEHRQYYMTTSSVEGLKIVDRRITPSDLWEHLPRMRTELNNKEHEEHPPEYRGLYSWDANDNKWKMRNQYREHWSVE